jgi:hypothetical protein
LWSAPTLLKPALLKLYLCDLAKATDVREIPSLQNPGIQLASKLILNMDDLGVFTDNIEGFWSKTNGKQSLLFVSSDNNFSDTRETQILLFEIE